MAQILNFPVKTTGIQYEYILQRVDSDGHVEWQIRGVDRMSNIKRVAQCDYDALSDLVGEPRVGLTWVVDVDFNSAIAEHDGYTYRIQLFEERNHAS